MAVYEANRIEFSRLMKSDMIGDHMENEAERLADHLRAVAPRGETGNYAASFHVATGLDILKKDRRAAFVYNDARYATALEVGSWNIRNPPAPMTKALDAFRD